MMIIDDRILRDVQENTLVSRECMELTRDDRPDRPDSISLDDIKYCDNQWGRFLKVDIILKTRKLTILRTQQSRVFSNDDAHFSAAGTISD